MILRLRSFYPSSSFSSSCRHAWKGQYPTLTSRLHVSSSIVRCQEPLNTKARHMKHISNLRVNLAILKEKRKEKNHSGRTPVARVVTNSIKEKGQQNDMSFYESLNMSSMSNKEVHAPTNGVMDEEGSNCSSSTTVDALLIRFLTGKGKPKDQIEKDTGTSIKVTSTHEGKAASVVDVKGHSEWAVQEALKRIQEVLNEAVKSQLQYTHFISLPLAIHPTLVEKLWSFQESVLALSSKCGGNADDHATELDSQSCEKDVANEISITSSSELTKTRSAIEKSIFVKPATFHLTVLMLKLWTEEQLKVAVEVLKGTEPLVRTALDGRPVAVRLTGLECMRGVPSKAHVLYVRVEEMDGQNRLLAACQVLINAFIEAGLVLEKDCKQSLKLHATVMNTTHRKKKKGKFKNLAFDATEIIAQHGSQDWGEYPILEAHLSQRFKYDQSGYYSCCGAISFP